MTLLTGSDAVADALSDLTAPDAPPPAAVRADVVPVPDELAGEVLADPRLAPLVVRQVRPATLWLTCNVDRAPLDRPQMRKVLAAAVDREGYVRDVLGGAGLPAHSLLPPGCPGHDPAAGTSFRPEPEVLRPLLAEAGGRPEDLAALRLTIPATDAGRTAGRSLLDGLERHLGVRLGLAELDRYAYVRALEQRRFDLALGGWESPYPDPEGWFWLVFGAGKAENRTGWESRTLDALWRAADAETDPGARLALYGAAQQVLLDEMPVVFLAHPQRLSVVHPRVAGLTPSVMDEVPGAASFREVRLLA
jgi:ABC-type oligopeptide transport system substrate-binding subunit